MIEKDSSTLESRMAALDEDWLAASAEEILEPELPIVDPHHHLWDFPTHRYLLDQLLADTGSGHNVEATVFVECGVFYRSDVSHEMQAVGEVEFVNDLAAMAASESGGDTMVAAGIVGFADLTMGAAVEEVLGAQVEAGGGRLRGIRYAAGWEDKTREIHYGRTNPPPHLYRDSMSFREGFARLSQLGLSFDAWLYHPQLDDVVDLARSFPDQPIVLNHVGAPLGQSWYATRREEVFAAWRASMVELARSENVCVKLGGLGMKIFGFDFDERERAPSSAELAEAWRPFIETAIELFGPRRCMFESNFPVDKISGSYANYWNAFKRLASGASAEDKAELFNLTARRFYRL